jgi:hypothetical protein
MTLSVPAPVAASSAAAAALASSPTSHTALANSSQRVRFAGYEWGSVSAIDAAEQHISVHFRNMRAIASDSEKPSPRRPLFPRLHPTLFTTSLWLLQAKPTARIPSRFPARWPVIPHCHLRLFRLRVCHCRIENIGSTHTSAFDQVAASRPVAFYASLAKKLLLDNATVELSAIGASLVTLSMYTTFF